jgi:DNA-binding PadR family transcriptional regulator
MRTGRKRGCQEIASNLIRNNEAADDHATQRERLPVATKNVEVLACVSGSSAGNWDYVLTRYICVAYSLIMRTTERKPINLLPLSTASFYILVALADADRHGYAIMCDIAERTSGKVKLNPGTLYTTIKRLLADGLVVELDERPDPEADDERRRYYRITAYGRRLVRAEAARLEELVAMARSAGLSPKPV